MRKNPISNIPIAVLLRQKDYLQQNEQEQTTRKFKRLVEKDSEGCKQVEYVFSAKYGPIVRSFNWPSLRIPGGLKKSLQF